LYQFLETNPWVNCSEAFPLTLQWLASAGSSATNCGAVVMKRTAPKSKDVLIM
jgi:hypothetical protein